MSRYRKLVVAVIGAAAVAVSRGLLPAEVGDWLTVLAPVLTALGIYAVPNAES